MSRSRFETWFAKLAVSVTILFGLALSAPDGISAQVSQQESTAQEHSGPVASSGVMRTLRGRHLLLVTDLPSSPDVDGLPKIFDQAISQWGTYFHVKPDTFANWKIRGYLMRNDQRFREQGFLPDDLPPFLHGYQRADALWVREQPSVYYQRHLLLHEGTHAFMRFALGGTGADWYMEGVAEHLATHRFRDGRLELQAFPQSREEVPHWGRIKLIRDAMAAGQARSLTDALQLGGHDFRRVDAYAWAWAAIVFLESNPRYALRFGDLQNQVSLPPAQFTARLWQSLQADRRQIQDAWEVFLAQLDYGYEPTADAIDYRPVKSFAETTRISIKTDRGWQSTGLQLSGGQVYRVRAHGRYQLVSGDEVWWSEAGGVSLEYQDGMPLGQLIGAFSAEIPAERPVGQASFSSPIPVGVDCELRPQRDAVLFLRINEPAGRRKDNQGSLLVQIEEVVDPTN
ncbi:MAG: hypothetical protein P8N76_14240 [Pirellulaceae bacterium]|nr:hypothetical protein [Pirellulaceae bacterium]